MKSVLSVSVALVLSDMTPKGDHTRLYSWGFRYTPDGLFDAFTPEVFGDDTRLSLYQQVRRVTNYLPLVTVTR